MGCAASVDTGNQYASLGHHGNQHIHVSKKSSTPTDTQLYGKNNNERPKSSSSSSSSESDRSKKGKETDNQQYDINILPPAVKLTEREKRQQSPTPPPPEPVPPPKEEEKKDPVPPPQEEQEKNDPVPPPPVEQEKNDPVPPPPVEQEKNDPVPPPPVEQEKNDPVPPPPVVQERDDSVPPTPLEDNKQGEDDATPSPPQPDDTSMNTDQDLSLVPLPITNTDDNKSVNEQPIDDTTPNVPVPTGGNDHNIDYNNTDDVKSPEPPNFMVSEYRPTDIGTFERSINFRTTSEELYNPPRPDPNDGGLYTDYEFSVEKAVPKARGLDWIRPGELPGVENPRLFTDGTTRFDIGQGRFGTCWFLSMVANIADKPRLLRRVIPGRSYKIGTSDYDGVFHCRFWRFGQWSDIFIDDKLPAQHGRLYGASNKEDRSEMWVALLEKAFARMYGSYEEVSGGRTADAFMNLTAGVGESIKFDKMKKSPTDLFQRLSNAFQSPTTMVGCVCPSQNDGQHGLVGGHAYSMNGTFKYGNTLLVRLRNPWGCQEWSGPWSDGSPEMAQASSAIPHPNKDDGEFYMDIDNFLRYFEQCTICNITPDFDRDGTGDTLSYVTTIYGNWRQGKAGGFQNKLQNPAYCVTVNDDGADGSGKVPLVVQIVQKTSDRQDDKLAIRVDLYKVLHEDSKLIVLDELGDKNNLYLVDFSSSYRFSVPPGRYVALPSTMNSSDENPKVLKEFLIRFFSAGPLANPAEVQDNTKIIAGKGPELDIQGKTIELPVTKCMPGRFEGGFNAGGQISCRDTFATNPQCFLTIREPQTIKVEIMQPDPDDPQAKMPLGIKLFRAEQSNFPADYEFLVSNYDRAVADTSGNDGPFSYGNSVDCGYSLDPGTYLLIVHSNGPEDQNDFALAIYSERNIDMETYHFTP